MLLRPIRMVDPDDPGDRYNRFRRLLHIMQAAQEQADQLNAPRIVVRWPSPDVQGVYFYAVPKNGLVPKDAELVCIAHPRGRS